MCAFETRQVEVLVFTRANTLPGLKSHFSLIFHRDVVRRSRYTQSLLHFTCGFHSHLLMHAYMVFKKKDKYVLDWR